MSENKLNLFIDVDGTLYQTIGVPNTIIVEMLIALKSRFNIYAWSGGGANYARQVIRNLGIPENIFDGYFSKLDNLSQEPDVTIDDEDYTAEGKLNLKIIGSKS